MSKERLLDAKRDMSAQKIETKDQVLSLLNGKDWLIVDGWETKMHQSVLQFVKSYEDIILSLYLPQKKA